MNYWDSEYGLAGLLFLAFSLETLQSNPALSMIGIAAGLYYLYESFVNIDPDGV